MKKLSLIFLCCSLLSCSPHKKILYFEKDNNLNILELEANPLDFDYNKTSLSATEIDTELNKAKAKLQKLQLERRNAVEAPTYSKAKSHSKTNENYMDYYQDSNSNTNTDVNYTNMKVTERRKELADLLATMSIGGATIGFIEGEGAKVMKKGLEYLFYAIGLEPKLEAIDNLYPLDMVVHIDKLTTYKYYKAVQGANLEFYQKERTPTNRESVASNRIDILDKLEQFGLKIKK